VWDVQDAKGGFAYSQSRMTHLLRLISESLIVYIESQLKGVDLWTGSFQVKLSRVCSPRLGHPLGVLPG
jgi:hypothetical protein